MPEPAENAEPVVLVVPGGQAQDLARVLALGRHVVEQAARNGRSLQVPAQLPEWLAALDAATRDTPNLRTRRREPSQSQGWCRGYSVRAAATVLGVSANAVQQRCRRDTLRHRWVWGLRGLQLEVDADQVDECARRRRRRRAAGSPDLPGPPPHKREGAAVLIEAEVLAVMRLDGVTDLGSQEARELRSAVAECAPEAVRGWLLAQAVAAGVIGAGEGLVVQGDGAVRALSSGDFMAGTRRLREDFEGALLFPSAVAGAA